MKVTPADYIIENVLVCVYQEPNLTKNGSNMTESKAAAPLQFYILNLL